MAINFDPCYHASTGTLPRRKDPPRGVADGIVYGRGKIRTRSYRFMFSTSGLLVPLCAAAVLSAAAQDTPKQLTARELFYSANQPPKSEPAKPPVQTPPVVKPPEKTATRVAKRVPSQEPQAPAKSPASVPVRPPQSAQLPDG